MVAPPKSYASGESRTAGSESGPGKRAGRKTGTAPRTDFTTLTARTGHSDSSRPPAALPPRSGAAIRPWLRDRSAASFTSTCRSPDLTEFSEPTGTKGPSELRVYGVDSSGWAPAMSRPRPRAAGEYERLWLDRT
jgi:hypothetical protein